MRAQNTPNWAFLGEQGEFCTAHAVRRGVPGEFCTGGGAVRLVLGEFCTGSGAVRLVLGEFCTGSGAVRLVLGEFCTGIGAVRLVLGEFCTGGGAVRLVLGEFYTEVARRDSCWGLCFAVAQSVCPVVGLPLHTGTAAKPSGASTTLHAGGVWCAGVLSGPTPASSKGVTP